MWCDGGKEVSHRAHHDHAAELLDAYASVGVGCVASLCAKEGGKNMCVWGGGSTLHTRGVGGSPVRQGKKVLQQLLRQPLQENPNNPENDAFPQSRTYN